MAEYFEVNITITKRIFIKAEDSENCDTIQDYIHDVISGETNGDVTVDFPIKLTTKDSIDLSKRHADMKIINC